MKFMLVTKFRAAVFSLWEIYGKLSKGGFWSDKFENDTDPNAHFLTLNYDQKHKKTLKYSFMEAQKDYRASIYTKNCILLSIKYQRWYLNILFFI